MQMTSKSSPLRNRMHKKIFKACEMWLQERLKLPISKEKSKITNLRKESSEFLGFEIKMVKKGK